MPTDLPFRFGYQLTRDDPTAAIAEAQRAEELGFDIVLAPDHVGLEPAPMPLLAAIAARTEAVRLGTFVINAAMRNPVQLAWEASTIDRLSDGRFELGLGAGHTPHEFTETGIELLPARARKAVLAEQVEIIRRLVDGDIVDHHGAAYTLHAACVARSTQDHLPILVGGNGAALLGHAGAHADIIGLQGLGRTLEDGHSHDAKWDPAHLDTQIEQVRIGAGERFDDLELNALVQFVDITDDAEQSMRDLGERHGLDPTHFADIPYVLIGTVDEIVAKLDRCRRRWGIAYFAVRTLDPFAAVIEACTG